MYKIVGKFFDEDINRECDTPDYAIGVFMALVQSGMQYTDSYNASDNVQGSTEQRNNYFRRLKSLLFFFFKKY